MSDEAQAASSEAQAASDADFPPPVRTAYSPLRILIYLVIGAVGLLYVLQSKSPADEIAGLLAQAQAAEKPAGKYQTGASAAIVYNLGAGYVLTVRVEGHADFPADCFFVIERLGDRDLAGQLLLDGGAGQGLSAAEIDSYLEILEIDVAPWDALCAKTRVAPPPPTPVPGSPQGSEGDGSK